MYKYDVIVVGAGIEGSSTAYQLVKRKKNVLLIEQFRLPHTRGSSHGVTRITRKAYGKYGFYSEMAALSMDMIRDLEKETGKELFINSAFLMVGKQDSDILNETEECFTKNNISYDKFDTDELRRRFPNMSYDENYRFLLDKSGGILMADRMLRAYQDQFRVYGGCIRDDETMLDVIPESSYVTITTSKGVYMATSVVLSLGPWATKFLPKLGLNLPLQPQRIPVCYWKEKSVGQSEGIVAFASLDEDAYYGLPSDLYQGHVKVCAHFGPDVDPDYINKADIQPTMEKLTSYVKSHFPTLHPFPSIQDTCIYTWTPDGHFILDKHPYWKNIIIGAGFSGHGFKLAPMVGSILADLSCGDKTSFDNTPFRIKRFSTNKL